MYPQVMLFHLQALEAKTEKSLQNSVVLNIDGTQNSSQYRLTATINFSELHSVLISASEKSLKKETQHWQVGEKLIINLNSLSGKLLISNSLCSFPWGFVLLFHLEAIFCLLILPNTVIYWAFHLCLLVLRVWPYIQGVLRGPEHDPPWSKSRALRG